VRPTENKSGNIARPESLSQRNPRPLARLYVDNINPARLAEFVAEKNCEQTENEHTGNDERARRRFWHGEELEEERLHDCFGWRLWDMNRIATREWSPSNKTFSRTSFKNQFMKTGRT